MISTRYIVESTVKQEFHRSDTWDDISEYLSTNPHPNYRLVSVALVKGTARLVWERRYA